MKILTGLILQLLCLLFKARKEIILENLALRQQLAIQQRHCKRPKLKKMDRLFWVWLSRVFSGWKSALIIVKPETVIRWHRLGFKLYWGWKSRSTLGRPKIPKEVRMLIKQMCMENPTWGAPRIHAELLILGYDVCETTIANYMIKPCKPPSQSWRTFLKSHLSQTVAVDFFTVPTVTFSIFYCFIVIEHHRRRIVHFNVTCHPTSEWTARQILEAFPFDTAPTYLLRDRDTIYGKAFSNKYKVMNIKEVLIAPQSPWQNPYCERVIGSIRKECLNHLIILNEKHLRKILTGYIDYYNNCRTHLSLDKNSPLPRDVDNPENGKIISIPKVNGLHHLYKRAA